MNSTTYELLIKALKADIETRTGLACNFAIDDKTTTDKPFLSLAYTGMTESGITAGGVVKNAAFSFKLKLTARTANQSQLAKLMEAEMFTTKAFKSLVQASDDPANSLTVTGYKATYFLAWAEQTNNMDYTQFERNWNLTLKITKE